MKRSLRVAALGLALCAGAAVAAPPAAILEAPEPGPALPVAVPTISALTLDNGLRVLLAPRPGLPLVSAQLLLLAGREADPAGKTGLAAMTTSLLTRGARRGTREVDAATLASQAEALGGGLDSFTGWRGSGVGMTVTTPKLAEALALVADVVRQPLLQAAELDQERGRALDALRVALDSPGSVAGLAAARAWWGDSVYGASPSAATLARLSVADVRAFHAAMWRPDRAVLVLAGDIDLERARDIRARMLHCDEQRRGHGRAAPQLAQQFDGARALGPGQRADRDARGVGGAHIVGPGVNAHAAILA